MAGSLGSQHLALVGDVSDEASVQSIVTESVDKLVSWNYRLVGPEQGFLAEGYSGVGRMSEPETIAEALAELAAAGADGIRQTAPGR